MKYKLLRFSLMCILAMLEGTLTPLWADTTGIITFGNNAVKINSTSVTGNDDLGNTWTITTAGTTSFTANADYYQVGSSSKPATSITFTTTLPNTVTVTSFSAKFGGNNGTAGTVSLKVGDTQVGTGSLNASNDVTVSSSISGTGTVLTVSVTGIEKGVKCYNISYTYTDPRTATTLTLGEHAETAVVEKSVDLPTATVTAGGTPVSGAVVTWSSSDKSVAVIEGQKINALQIGETTITATYAGNDTYDSSVATYKLKVEESSEIANPYTYTFDAAKFTESVKTVKLKAVNWTVTSSSTYFGYDGPKGQQFGSGNNPAKSLTLTTSDIPGTITGVKLNTCGASSIAATVGVTVGGKALNYGDGSTASLTSTATDYVFTGSASGDITISYAQTSSKAIYIKSIEVTYSTATEPAGFRDFAVNLTNATAIPTTNTNFGVKVAGDGSYTAVAADDATANFTVSAARFNDKQHGWVNCVFTVPVEGPVLVKLGDCKFGDQTGTIKDAADNVTELTKPAKQCWDDKSPDQNVVATYYRGLEPTTLTISYTGYCPFISVTAVDPADLPAEVTKYTVAFTTTGVSCEGVAPAELTVEEGEKFTVPANTSLFADGKTLTAWSDGSNQYKAGDVVTVNADMTLVPVFTNNTVSLADRTEAVTLQFPLCVNAGSQKFNLQGSSNGLGLNVAQATIGDQTIDVKMVIDATTGKFAYNKDEWTQVNVGTKLTIPSCKDATVALTAFSAFGADGKTATTIDGQSDYTSATSISYTIASASETVDIVFGDDAGYVTGNLVVTLPVVQSQGGGQTFVNEDATITWAMGVTEANVTADAAPEGAFSLTSISHGSKLDNTSKGDGVTTYDGVTYTDYQPKETANGTSGFEVVWNVKPATGITFTLTGVSAGNYRNGTNGGNIKYVIRKKDGTETELGTIIPGRNTANGANPNYTFAKSGLNQELSDEFALVAYIGGDLANNKQIGFANVKIEGKVNGTAVAVNKYTLATAAVPAEGGSVSAYPAADEYEEGSTVKLTATENFGYDFVNWTDANGEEVSTDAVYTFDIAKNETLTANFVKVNTYELALTVDGTNDYMVTIDPAPTMVGGKMMYEASTAVQLTANQYEGLVTFNNWSDGETSSSKLISMTADTQLTAVYSQADIVAGWDFYKKGNGSRIADFASELNVASALSLVNTESGEAKGWLDKSTEAAGGYEGFKGAAVNWTTGSGNGDVGHCHWQTKVNTTDFTNINVQFQMLYNYNAYKTYDAEYSLDGEEWTKFGSIAMTGAKVVATFNGALPEACNNQKNVFIRMIADKTSKVDGSASANDGNALAMFFITGTEKLVDDGNAPELVSTVPVGNTTGVSASGKVVLTFDEKVKLAEGTTAYINDTKINSETQIAVSGAVSGKSISFEYKGLEYTTEYSFVLPANSVSDLTDNTLESPVRLTFTTMTRPTVTKGLYDEVVDNVEQLVAAIGKAETRSDKNVRYRIFLKNGTYQLPQGTADVTHNVELKNGSSQQIVTKDVITYIKSGNISLIGESRDGVIITNTIPANETFEGKYGTASVYEGIGSSDVLQVSGSGLYFQDLTISTGMADGRGRDIALNDKGTQNVFKNVCLHGYQDTWKSGKGLYYFEGGVIRGRTDFLCGGGDAFFNQVDIVMCEKGGYVVAPQGNSHYGYVFKDCTLKGEAGDVSGNYNLGRAWTAEAETYFINTTMEALPNAKGWAEWNNGPKRFAEFNSKTATGTDVDLSSRAKTINGTPNVPVLTAEEAIEIGDLHNSFGDWDPTLLTEQAPVPQNVKQEGNNLVWDNSNYALLWAIVKDGSVVGFTTEPTYKLTESGTYAVRAANEMGGLSEVSESVEVVKVTLNASGYATLASAKALDFSAVEGLTAYIVKEQTADKAILTSVTATPAETGLVLKGAAGTEYTIPVATSATSIEGNLLVAAVTATTVGAKSVYVLDGDKFKVFTGTEIPAGKAYLPMNSNARLLELIFDDATAIGSVNVDVNVNQIYDLQGRRVKTPSKGVYVVDGKKVIIK